MCSACRVRRALAQAVEPPEVVAAHNFAPGDAGVIVYTDIIVPLRRGPAAVAAMALRCRNGSCSERAVKVAVLR
jgi:hypothetical protein